MERAEALETGQPFMDTSPTSTVKVKVKKHHKVSGVLVVDEMESSSETPAGIVASDTACTNIKIFVDGSGGSM